MSNEKLNDGDLLDGLSLWYLKSSGLWGILNHYRETGERNRLLKIWLIGMLIGFTPLFISSIAGPFFTGKDLEGLTLVVLNPMTVVQQTVKFVVLWVYIEKQTQLLDLMKKDFLTCAPEHQKPEVTKILSKAVKEANIYAWLGFGMNFFTVTIWNSIPVLRSEFFRLNLGITAFGTPVGPNKILGFWYPLDLSKSPANEIVYVYEFFTSIWAALMISLMECLLVQLVTLLTGHLNAFKYLIGNLRSSRDAKLDKEQLLVYVKEHERLMRVGSELCNMYEFAVTVELTTGFFILIFAVFNFILRSTSGDVVLMAKFIIYTMYTLVEISLYCVTGNNLETMSEEVCFATYSCEWYKMDPELRKTLQMLMVRSRRPILMKAGKIYPVNLTALTNILQMAYSTSMILYRATVPEAQQIK